ncbi:MAG: ABC transporter permease [Rhodobacteraceae bacterium]|nr:ABC transporter permease [Paracoccaceae bacterium]MCY4140188.1 ABC transporter permease [Paracoccaceae bacterium]
MAAYVLRRLTLFVPMLIGIVAVTFGIMQLLPGDPAAVLLGEDASDEAVREMRRALGLDRPWWIRLAAYYADLFRGEMGDSYFQNQPVVNAIAQRLVPTLEVAFVALLVSIILGVALGIAAAVRRGSLVDAACMLFAQLGVSMPVFWFGILLMYLFAIRFDLLPSIGRGPPLLFAAGQALAGRPAALGESLMHIAMPALTLGLTNAAVISRLVRSSMLETLGQDFVRTANAKGLRPARVVFVHALRNALLPVVSVIGLRFGALLGGAVLTESIFGWPGLGQLAVSAISQRDIPLVQGIVLTFALAFAIVNLVVDLLYAVIDPRIRLE